MLRRLPLLFLLTLLAALAAMPARADQTSTLPGLNLAPQPQASADVFPFLGGVPRAVGDAVVRIDRDEARRLRELRVAEARRLRSSSRPEAVVRRAWLLNVTSRATYDDQRAVLTRARLLARTLGGVRGTEQRSALSIVTGMAAAHVLTIDRLRPVLLTLARNSDWWVARDPPPYGKSIVRGDSPITLRYIPGQGLVLHQLGSWSRVDYTAGACLRDRVNCPRTWLREAIDAMLGLTVRRDGVVRAESYFRFGQARGPWISAMTQGSVVQTLARASAVLHSKPDRRVALSALGAFARSAPEGVSVPAAGGHHFLMYSTAPGLHILNGFLHALTGLKDLADISGSRRALALYRRGEHAARIELRKADTGAWSRYSEGGAESTLAYHELVTGFLDDLCDRHAGKRYCSAAARFHRYVKEPTRVSVTLPQRARARSTRTVRVWISKVSSLSVTIRDARDRVVLQQRVTAPRGTRRFAWFPPRRGPYRVLVTAAGPGTPPLGRAVSRITVWRSAAAVARAKRLKHAKAVRERHRREQAARARARARKHRG